MLLRQLKFNFGFINANVYPLAVAKSKPDLRLSKGRFEFRGPVTPGDSSGATSDKPNRADENLQPSDRLPIRTSKNANLQPASEKTLSLTSPMRFMCCGFVRRTSLLSDAPPSAPSMKPWRNRRVHWSSFVRWRSGHSQGKTKQEAPG